MITPSPAPSPGPPGTIPAAQNNVSPAGRAVDVVAGAPATPILALIGLAVAFLLTMTRLSVRRRRKVRRDTAGVVPPITPTPSPGPPATNPAAERSVGPAGPAEDVAASAPAAPVLGLIALGVAFLLVTTRLFTRRRRNGRGPGT